MNTYKKLIFYETQKERNYTIIELLSTNTQVDRERKTKWMDKKIDI